MLGMNILSTTIREDNKKAAERERRRKIVLSSGKARILIGNRS